VKYTRRRSLIYDTGWYGEKVDTVRPEAIGVRANADRDGRDGRDGRVREDNFTG
jgi:hypothetical protein